MMEFPISNKPIILPGIVHRRIEGAARSLLEPDKGPRVDFGEPAGEAALLAADSLSWRVFKNPVALFTGGVAAVILELAEPRVRTGVWEHSGFRKDPVARLRRTGLAAMVTVYGARSVAEAMIAKVRQMHERVRGKTPAGEPYYANDPVLLNWVHATAAFGFLQAYHAYVRPMPLADRDRYYGEGATSARLYGVTRASVSEAEIDGLFETMRDRLERSDIIFEFLGIMKRAPVLPPLLRPAQRFLVRAAIDLTPEWARGILGLRSGHGLLPWQRALVRHAGMTADRVILQSSPAVNACRRMGLPADYLYS